ncbi:hypothetical protein V5O48_015697, partial [Marasmius crinis-equi]
APNSSNPDATQAPDSSEPRRSKRAPKPTKSKNGKKKDGNKKKKKDRFHLTKDEVDPALDELKRAMQTQICLMWLYYDTDNQPPQPDDAMKKQFLDRYTSYDEFVKETGRVPKQSKEMKERIKALRRNMQDVAGLGQRLIKVDEDVLNITAMNLARYHIDAWCPDLHEDSSSDYNKFHRWVLIDTFRQVVKAGGYAEYQIDQTFMDVDGIGKLAQLYDNYVFSYVMGLFRIEEREKGALAKRKVERAEYMRRKRLGNARFDQAVTENLNIGIQRGVKVADGVSEDEEIDARKKHYRVKSVPARSRRYTQLVRLLDRRKTQNIALLHGAFGKKKKPTSGQFQERTRQLSDTPPEGEPRLPDAKTTPLDFFDPEFFNSLAHGVRALYSIKPFLSLPSKDEVSIEDFVKTKKWRGMSREEITKKWSGKVFALYDLVPKEELAKMRMGVPEMDSAEDDERDDFVRDMERAMRKRAEEEAAREKKARAKSKKQHKGWGGDEEEGEGEWIDPDDSEDSQDEDYEGDDDDDSDDDDSDDDSRPKGKKKGDARPKGGKDEDDDMNGGGGGGGEEEGEEEEGEEEEGTNKDGDGEDEGGEEGKRDGDIDMDGQGEQGEKKDDKGKGKAKEQDEAAQGEMVSDEDDDMESVDSDSNMLEPGPNEKGLGPTPSLIPRYTGKRRADSAVKSFRKHDHKDSDFSKTSRHGKALSADAGHKKVQLNRIAATRKNRGAMQVDGATGIFSSPLQHTEPTPTPTGAPAQTPVLAPSMPVFHPFVPPTLPPANSSSSPFFPSTSPTSPIFPNFRPYPNPLLEPRAGWTPMSNASGTAQPSTPAASVPEDSPISEPIGSAPMTATPIQPDAPIDPSTAPLQPEPTADPAPASTNPAPASSNDVPAPTRIKPKRKTKARTQGNEGAGPSAPSGSTMTPSMKRTASTDFVRRPPASRDGSEADLSEVESVSEEKMYIGGRQVWKRDGKEGEVWVDKDGVPVASGVGAKEAGRETKWVYKSQPVFPSIDPASGNKYWVDKDGQPLILDSRALGGIQDEAEEL